MKKNSESYAPPDTVGHDEQSEHLQAAEPGQNGLSHGLTKAYLNSQEGIHVRTHLKKTLIEIFGDDGCERWQVKKLFEKYDLKNL